MRNRKRVRNFAVNLLFCFLAVTVQNASAQTLEAKIEVLSPETAKIRVEVKTSNARKRWAFINSYANANNLNARIENLKFLNEENREVSVTKQNAGEFESDAVLNRFSYEMKLDFPANAAQAAHVSSLTKERGLLQLGDLLPDFEQPTAAKISFVLPTGWKIATSESKTGENQFQTSDFENAVFLVGSFTEQIDKSGIHLARAGEWSFTEAETLDVTAKILAEHRKTFGAMPSNKIQIILLPFPQDFGGERWEAETRGSTVVLFSGVLPFKSRALSKLHEQLRHELFHLWIPNTLHLEGDYAWFYEGFTIYQALKTGVRLKQIRFVDFLDTMSRAFDVARRSPQNKTLSLLEASKLRWSIDNSEFVYAKGMITAFLYDLALLRESKGSLNDVFKELYRKHKKPNAVQNANQAVLSILKSSPEMRGIIERTVETAGEVDWTQDLAAVGLQNSTRGSFTRLSIIKDLNGRQKKLLERLGYNSEFRN